MCEIIDMSSSKVDEIVNYLNSVALANVIDDHPANRDDVYCGITNDLEQTKTRHQIEHYIACVDCGSYEKASQVETLMGQHYDIGNPPHEGNGGANDSKYVYIFKKTTDSDPSL